MLPANESASGFFYFRAFYRSGSTLILQGVREASTAGAVLLRNPARQAELE